MKSHTEDELASGMRELEEQSDRGAAIIAAALIDHHLAVAIEGRLMPLNSTLRDNIFGSRGTLAGFQSKIDMGLALGLYTKDAHRELDTIRRIRNRFAHTPIALDFQDAEVKRLSLSLMSTILAERKEPRDRFMIAYLGLASLLYYMSKKDIRLHDIAEIHPTLGAEVAAAVFGALPEKS
jgi:hypothetical protein